MSCYEAQMLTCMLLLKTYKTSYSVMDSWLSFLALTTKLIFSEVPLIKILLIQLSRSFIVYFNIHILALVLTGCFNSSFQGCCVIWHNAKVCLFLCLLGNAFHITCHSERQLSFAELLGEYNKPFSFSSGKPILYKTVG